MSKFLKVILLQDIPNVGQKNDIKSVSFGFAKNWLIPQKLATLVRPTMISNLQKQRELQLQKRKKEEALYQELTQRLASLTLIFKPKKTSKGTLYAAINAKKIAESLKKKKIDIGDPKYIILEEPIKKVGKYEIPVTVSETLQARLRVVVQ